MFKQESLGGGQDTKLKPGSGGSLSECLRLALNPGLSVTLVPRVVAGVADGAGLRSPQLLGGPRALVAAMV